MIKFAAISPHAPILLPEVGSVVDRKTVHKTIESLKKLQRKFDNAGIEEIIISSPHDDWGFNVPLTFLAPKFSGKITRYLTTFESPSQHFTAGKDFTQNLDERKNYALIASGDLSHVLKADGPYGYHPQGPKFDSELIKLLKENNTPEILKLDERYPNAADCGLRSFAFAFGLLENAGVEIKTEILSYEGPFGVGYLVAQLV